MLQRFWSGNFMCTKHLRYLGVNEEVMLNGSLRNNSVKL
jgi:hypothetical protein